MENITLGMFEASPLLGNISKWDLLVHRFLELTNNTGVNRTVAIKLLSVVKHQFILKEEVEQTQQRFHCSNHSATLDELVDFVTISWWIDDFSKTIVATIGVILNILSLPILFSNRLKSVFNCLLTHLLIGETVYMLSEIFQTFQKTREPKDIPYMEILFTAYLLHPMKHFLICYSFYMAAVMARERFVALRCPIRYHNDTSGLNPWPRAVRLCWPFALLSALFVFPIFFEIDVNQVRREEEFADVEVDRNFQLTAIYPDPLKSNIGQAPNLTENLTKLSIHDPDQSGQFFEEYMVYELRPSKLRFDPMYVLLYKNITHLLVELIFPLILLAHYNWSIITVLRRRRRLINRPIQSINSRSAMLKAEEARKAYILLAITFLFMVCYSASSVVRFYELISLKEYQEAVDRKCNPAPMWILIMESVSHLLLTLNASACCLLYCVTNRDFQEEVKMYYARFRQQMSSGSDSEGEVENNSLNIIGNSVQVAQNNGNDAQANPHQETALVGITDQGMVEVSEEPNNTEEI